MFWCLNSWPVTGWATTNPPPDGTMEGLESLIIACIRHAHRCCWPVRTVWTMIHWRQSNATPARPQAHPTAHDTAPELRNTRQRNFGLAARWRNRRYAPAGLDCKRRRAAFRLAIAHFLEQCVVASNLKASKIAPQK